jgi:non-ribosomal peptide synthetase component F/acyl carrier protein
MFQIWAPLLHGVRLVILPPHQPSIRELGLLIKDQGVTFLYLTPALLHMVIDHELDCLQNVRQVIVGGEVLSPRHARKLLERFPACRLINVYGPTETTIDATRYLVPAGDWGCVSVPLGRPIANTQAYILDAGRNPAPAGEIGELCIGGDGVARGYLNRPELTAERFIPGPFSETPGARLYRTGDLARWLPDGNIEFLGRNDDQVKIRGFRIELGEIEAVLQEHGAVERAVVLAREGEDGNKRLVAYVVACNESGDGDELREFVSAKLPDYMLPDDFVFLRQFPLTAHGKIDRAALPRPARVVPAEPDTAPRTEIEQKLAAIWREVLRTDVQSVHDSFFALGGQSLLAMLMISRVQEAFGVELRLRSVFQHPTLAQLANMIAAARGSEAAALAAIPRARCDQPLPLSFSQQRVWFLERMHPGNRAYNFQASLHFRGALQLEALERSLGEIVRRHDTLRTSVVEVDGEPQQRVHNQGRFKLTMIDLSRLSPSERARELVRLQNAELQKAFDLTRLPLVRWTLFRLQADEHALLHVEHHLVHDGWSFHVFLGEVVELYRAFAAGRPSPLPELEFRFADFVLWEREQVSGERLERDLQYWTRKLAGAPASLPLPLDHPRPPVQTFRGAAPRFELPKELCRSLRSLAAQRGVTQFTVLLAGFAALLQRYSGATDLCIATTDSNRRRREWEGLIGMLVVNLILRMQVSPADTFEQVLERAREEVLAAHEHPHAPFEKIVEALHLSHNLERNPVAQVMFSSQDAVRPKLDIPGLRLHTHDVLSNGTAKFDLNIIVLPWGETHEEADEVTMIWEYNSDLFEESTIQEMLRDYRDLLQSAIANPARRIGDLPITARLEGMRSGSRTIAGGVPVAGLNNQMEDPINAEIESAVIDILKDVLRRETITREDDFFELGGHSLVAMKVVARINRAFGIRLPLRTMFEVPAVAQLAAAVAELRTESKTAQDSVAAD